MATEEHDSEGTADAYAVATLTTNVERWKSGVRGEVNLRYAQGHLLPTSIDGQECFTIEIMSNTEQQPRRINIHFTQSWTTVARTLRRGERLWVSGAGLAVEQSKPPHNASRMDHTLCVILRDVAGVEAKVQRLVDPAPGDNTNQHEYLDWEVVRPAPAFPPAKRARLRSTDLRYTPLAELSIGDANILAVVVKFTLPRPTRGSDYFVQMDLVDQSTWSIDDESTASKTIEMKCFIKDFNSGPDVLSCGDVLRIHRVQVKTYQDAIELLGNRRSSFIVYPATGSDLTPRCRSKTHTPNSPETQMRVERLRAWSRRLFQTATQCPLFQNIRAPLLNLEEALTKSDTEFIDVCAKIVFRIDHANVPDQQARRWPTEGGTLLLWDGSAGDQQHHEQTLQHFGAALPPSLHGLGGCITVAVVASRQYWESIERMLALEEANNPEDPFPWLYLRNFRVAPSAFKRALGGAATSAAAAPSGDAVFAAVENAKQLEFVQYNAANGGKVISSANRLQRCSAFVTGSMAAAESVARARRAAVRAEQESSAAKQAEVRRLCPSNILAQNSSGGDGAGQDGVVVASRISRNILSMFRHGNLVATPIADVLKLCGVDCNGKLADSVSGASMPSLSLPRRFRLRCRLVRLFPQDFSALCVPKDSLKPVNGRAGENAQEGDDDGDFEEEESQDLMSQQILTQAPACSLYDESQTALPHGAAGRAGSKPEECDSDTVALLTLSQVAPDDYVYAFSMLVEDLTGTLRVLVYGEEAKLLLSGLPPCDLERNNVSKDALRKLFHPLMSNSFTHELDCCVHAEKDPGSNLVRFRIFGTELLQSNTFVI